MHATFGGQVLARTYSWSRGCAGSRKAATASRSTSSRCWTSRASRPAVARTVRDRVRGAPICAPQPHRHALAPARTRQATSRGGRPRTTPSGRCVPQGGVVGEHTEGLGDCFRPQSTTGTGPSRPKRMVVHRRHQPHDEPTQTWWRGGVLQVPRAERSPVQLGGGLLLVQWHSQPNHRLNSGREVGRGEDFASKYHGGLCLIPCRCYV